MENVVLDKGLDVGGKLKRILPIKGRWQFMAVAVSLSFLPMIMEMYLVYTMLNIFQELLAGNQTAALGFYKLVDFENKLLVFYYIFFAVSVVAVCVWFYRANQNIGMAGLKNVEQSPGMAVGWFFVPIANLFMPFNTLKEIDKGSQSMSKPEEHNSWKENKTQSLLIVWFVTYLICQVLFSFLYFKTRALEGKSASIETMHSFINLCYMYLAGYTIRIVSGVSLILCTRKITQAHNNHIILTEQ
jgi:hypothetical protein